MYVRITLIGLRLVGFGYGYIGKDSIEAIWDFSIWYLEDKKKRKKKTEMEILWKGGIFGSGIRWVKGVS